MPHAIPSMELAQVLAEAEDIARSVNQKLTSAHQLLAFFTVPNRAEILLKERGVDEDRILAAMTGTPKERDGIERDLRERAKEIADGTGAEEVDCLHLLIAMSRVRASAAHQLLSGCKLSPATLGNVALSFFTSRMPRRLRELQPVRVGPFPTPQARTSPRPAPADASPAATAAPLPDATSSARTALLLKKKGIHRVRPLEGGLDAWRERKFPIERRAKTATVPAPSTRSDSVSVS